MSFWLVIVTGAPGTGKTTLGRRLAADLGLPFVNKDRIKERLHDDLGTGTLEDSRRLGKASYGLLFDFAEALLTAQTSFVIESNFTPEFHNIRLTQLASDYGCSLLQLHLYTDGGTLYRRLKQRRERGERHPAHLDVLPPEDVKQETVSNIAPALDIPGLRIDIDSTDFTQVDYPLLLRRIRSAILFSPARSDEAHTRAE